EGCCCPLNRNGLLMLRRQPGPTFGIDRIHRGLPPVPMAVTASSAFPGFFPPLELTAADVGAIGGEFGRQAYTDGGVFDNLGVRMFGCLARSLLAEGPLSRDDFLDFPAVVEVLQQASKSREEPPLRRLAQVLAATCSHPRALPPGPQDTSTSVVPSSWGASPGGGEEWLLSGLWNVMRHHPMYREPLFA